MNWTDIERSCPPILSRLAAEEARQDAEEKSRRDRINAFLDRQIDRAENDRATRYTLIAGAGMFGLLVGWLVETGFTFVNAARIAGGW